MMNKPFESIFGTAQPEIEPKTEVDRMRKTWEEERITPFSMPGHDGLEPDQVAEKERDVQRLEEKWGKTNDITGNRLKKDLNLEFVIYHDLEQKNWLKEDERYDKLMGDEKGFFLRTFPAAKYDDYHHGMDIICVINNANTGFESIPFGIDPTSDIRDGKVAHHLNTPYKDINNRTVAKYNERRNNNEREIKGRGLTSLTFFEDKSHSNDESYQQGSIPMLPRFVVGFNSEMAEQISTLESLHRRPVSLGTQWATVMSSVDKKNKGFENWGDPYSKTPEEVTSRLNELEQRANWIVVHELSTQADMIRKSLSLIQEPDENIQKMCRHLDCLKKYFDDAKQIVDKETPKELRHLCKRDKVYNSINHELKIKYPSDE